MRTHTSPRVWSFLAAFLLLTNILFGAVPAAIAAPSSTGATVASDLPDYPAGAAVTLTGAGWAAGETVHIFVNDDAGQTWSLNSSPDPVADAGGGFTYKFNLPATFIASYSVTATGPVSGTATTSFTDGQEAVNLDQCRNGSAASPNDCKDFGGNTGWVNGNVGASQAHMLEGYSTPFRAVMTNLPTGTAITLIIGYDIRNSGANAYDYLTQYQRLEPHSYFGHPAETVYPTDGVTGLSANTSTFPIPVPSTAGSTVAGQPAASFNSLPAAERVMTLFGGTISAMSYVSQGSLTASQSETQISVTFTADNPTAVLAWGGHISQCSVWGTTNGTCNSAGGINGSPYHMRLVSWGPNLSNLGNTDKSMAASVVVQPGNLTLAKSLTGGPSGYTGPFTINYDCGVGFVGSVSVSAGSSQTINGIPSGSVCTISETPPAAPTGYTFGTPTFSPSSSVTIGQGTTVTVTTNNTLTRDLGSLKLTKSLTGGPSGYTGPFTINYDCGTGYTGSVSLAAGGSQTVSGIPTGNSCTISETLPGAPSGYTFGTPTFSPSDTVTISASTTVEVTTNNTLTLNTGSLKIFKTLSNPDGASVPASFTINYDCGTGFTGSVSVAAGGSQTVSGIPTGSICDVTEPALTPITGYTWADPVVTGSPATIGNGTTVEVTVANAITRDLGSLVLAKTLSGGPSGYTGSFTINYDCGTGYTGSVSVAAGGSQTVNGIPTGASCAVSETLPAPPSGYSFGTPAFSPADTVTIPAGNGSSVTVTTNNTLTRDTGSLKISKTLSNPDGATVPASFTINYDCGNGFTGSVSVAAGGSQTVSGIPTGSTCTVSEAALTPITGYTWGTPTTTPDSVVISSTTGAFTLTVANTITRDRGTLTVVKKVVNDNGGTATVSAFGLNTSAGSLTFDSGVANGSTTTYTSQKMTVVTGTYTLKENAVYGYAAGAWSCTGAAGTVVSTFNNGSVQVGTGEDVVCTITNNDQPGTIVIIKNAKPAQGSFAFTTTGSGYNGFTLTGATTNSGNQNSQTLNAGTYTVKESTQLSWILTGLGNPADSTNPYNCLVTGSGGSTGSGDLTTQTATISLKNGDTVTCYFENTGLGATRTQGFWATHPQLAQIAWFGGTAYGHTFPGVAATTGIGDRTLCGRAIEGPGTNDISKLMGGFWSSISTTTSGGKRTALDQARMQLLQQLLAAELNASAFGSVPASGSFAGWESAYCGTNQTAIKNAQQQAASFNSQGDSSTFTPGTSANSKLARSIANLKFWDVLP